MAIAALAEGRAASQTGRRGGDGVGFKIVGWFFEESFETADAGSGSSLRR